MLFAKSAGGGGGQPPDRAGSGQVAGASGTSQVASQLQASAGAVACAMSLRASPRDSLLPQQASSGPGIEWGAMKFYMGLHSCPNSTLFLQDTCSGAPVVPRPNVRYTGTRRNPQYPWAHQLSGHRRTQTGKPYNARKGSGVTPEARAPCCGAKGGKGRALWAGDTLYTRTPNQEVAW